MSLEILETKKEIRSARAVLRQEGLSFIDSSLVQWLRRRGIVRGFGIGDYIKSWDVLRTAKYIQNNCNPDARILDIGAFASEILLILKGMKFRKLLGVDLNPLLSQMPGRDSIDYQVGDFLSPALPSGVFDVITAISVIEHGYSGPALFEQISRLLKPGGTFIASFDYWPDKIDTQNIKLFDLSWTIFSKEDAVKMFQTAEQHGLSVGGAPVKFETLSPPPLCYYQRRYTFAWMVLQKNR